MRTFFDLLILLVCLAFTAEGSGICLSAAVSPSASSICKAATLGICSDDPSSAIIGAEALANTMDQITSVSQTAIAADVCTALGGYVNVAWTDPTEACPAVPTCEEGGCGSDSDGDGDSDNMARRRRKRDAVATATPVLTEQPHTLSQNKPQQQQQQQQQVGGSVRIQEEVDVNGNDDARGRKEHHHNKLRSATLAGDTYPSLGFQTHPVWLSKKDVVLTFDDGPGWSANNETEIVLDILKEYNLKATFFFNSAQDAETSWTTTPAINIVQRVIAEGHELGVHTRSHLHLPTLDYATMREEIYGTEDEIRTYVPTLPTLTLFRAPFGEPFQWHDMNDSRAEPSYDSIAPTVAARFINVGWTFDSQDALCSLLDPSVAPQCVLGNITSQLEAGNYGIILMHSIHLSTAQALPSIISYLNTNGYNMRSVEYAVQNKFGGSSADVVLAYNNGTMPVEDTYVFTTVPGETVNAAAMTAPPADSGGSGGSPDSTATSIVIPPPPPPPPPTTLAGPVPAIISLSLYPGSSPDPVATCCDSLRTYVTKFCTGIPYLEDVLVANSNFTLFQQIPRLANVTNCADTNCQDWSGATSLNVSVTSLVLSVLLAVWVGLVL